MGRDEVILLDTHAAVWLVTNDSSLGPRSRSIARSALADGTLGLSAISFWEIALLVSKGRMNAARSPAEQRMTILRTGMQELPLTGDIAVMAVELFGLPADPVDRFIVATAITHGATLVTADAALLKWRHPVKRQDASK
jgi:PIN domain nuclease of toxin-antitoxin system